jgi:hypothetical protein
MKNCQFLYTIEEIAPRDKNEGCSERPQSYDEQLKKYEDVFVKSEVAVKMAFL